MESQKATSPFHPTNDSLEENESDLFFLLLRKGQLELYVF